jgi:hypothetical protein
VDVRANCKDVLDFQWAQFVFLPATEFNGLVLLLLLLFCERWDINGAILLAHLLFYFPSDQMLSMYSHYWCYLVKVNPKLAKRIQSFSLSGSTYIGSLLIPSFEIETALLLLLACMTEC